MLKVAVVSVFLVAAADSNAQSITGRVTGAVGSTGIGTSVSGAGNLTSGAASNPFSVLNDPVSGSSVGGDLPGTLGVKVGDKVINFRGAVGVGDDRSNFRAGAGIRF